MYIYIIYIHVEESRFFALALMARYCFVVAWLLWSRCTRDYFAFGFVASRRALRDTKGWLHKISSILHAFKIPTKLSSESNMRSRRLKKRRIALGDRRNSRRKLLEKQVWHSMERWFLQIGKMSSWIIGGKRARDNKTFPCLAKSFSIKTSGFE